MGMNEEFGLFTVYHWRGGAQRTRMQQDDIRFGLPRKERGGAQGSAS
jgi:hypothetical protein